MKKVVIHVTKAELEVDSLTVQLTDNSEMEERERLLEEKNSLDLHVTGIKEECAGDSYDCTLEVKSEDTPVSINSAEASNSIDLLVTEIKSEYVDHNYSLVSEMIFEETPVPVEFPLLKTKAKTRNVWKGRKRKASGALPACGPTEKTGDGRCSAQVPAGMESQLPECNCQIEKILKHGFDSQDFSQKKRIIELGRPMSDLKKLRVQTKSCVRKFNLEYYSKVDWLCGCSNLAKLFCWPCLLFNNEKNVWNKTGYSDVNNFYKAMIKHENSQSHITSAIQLASFGISRFDLRLDSEKRVAILQHNEEVKENRDIIKRLIDIICHLGKRELALCDHDESDNSADRGNYVELVHLLKRYDPILNEHIKHSNGVVCFSNQIQNDLIESINNVIVAEIRKEVHNAPFVAIMVDDTTDMRSQSQLSVILRYATSDGVIQERFVGFSDVSTDQTPSALANQVIDYIAQYDFGSKIVAQTYDGAVVIPSEINALQAKVREKFPGALFIHSMSHEFNHVLSQSVSCIRECNVFFKTLDGFSSFFSKSSKRAHYLDQAVKKKFPRFAPARRNYTGHLVETVYEYKSELITMFENIIESPDGWDNETYIAAQGFLSVLNDFTFSFLLTVFKNLFSVTTVLSEILQTKSNNISICIHKLAVAKENIASKREEFKKVFSETSDEQTTEAQNKRTRLDNEGDVEKCLRKIYFDILDNVINQIDVRFQNLDKLQFLELIKPYHGKEFPEIAFSSLKSVYGEHFDFPRLRGELSVCYCKKDLKNKSASELLCYLKAMKIDRELFQLRKLCELIVTIPASSASVAHSSSALDRIKTYIRNSQAEDRPSSLSLLSVEKELLETIRSNEDFYVQVIDDFAVKERGIALVFK
ncbi:zinc finger MYM-type protein 1-like isoform X2 [Periplaneta americana]|uniref:zinc finger MYM-type protein 1-like isoform X2 n=1 Tax=Periplaneta americana TaxID=6978 RepID=UPI0037E7A865